MPPMIQSSSQQTISFTAPPSAARDRASNSRRFSASSINGAQPLSIFSPEDFKRSRKPVVASSSSSTSSNVTGSAPRLPPSPSASSVVGWHDRRLDLPSPAQGPQPRNLSAPPTPLLGSGERRTEPSTSVSSFFSSKPENKAERKTSDEALAARLRREAEEEWDGYRRTRSLATVGGSGSPAPGPGAQLAKSSLLVRRQQKEQVQPATTDSQSSRGGLESRKSSSISLSRSDLSDVVQPQPPYLSRRRHKPGLDELRSISVTSQRSSLILFDTDDDDGDEARLLRTRDSLRRSGSSPPTAPLPSTVNLLSERERAREVRRTQKLAQLLGDEVRDGGRRSRLSAAPGTPPLPRRGSDPVESVSSGLRRTATMAARRMTRRGSVDALASGAVDTAVIDDPPSDVGRKAAAILGLAIVAPGAVAKSRPVSMEFLDDGEGEASVDEALTAVDEREMALARQREERRRRVAKVSRWLGTAVPPHLIHSGSGPSPVEQSPASPSLTGGFAISPTLPNLKESAAGLRIARIKMVRSPTEPGAMSDADRGLGSPRSAQGHFHNVRRATKLASVFGQAPPQRLFAGAAGPSTRPAPGRASYEASLNSLEYLFDHDRALLGDMIEAMSDGAGDEGARHQPGAIDEEPATAVTSFFTYDSSDAGSDGDAPEEAPQGTWSGGEADSSTTTDDEDDAFPDAARQSSWLEGRHRQHRAQAARAQKLSRFFGESAAAVAAEEGGGYGLPPAQAPPVSRLRSLHRVTASQASISLGGGLLRPRAAKGLGRLLDSFEGEAGDDPKLSDADRKAIAQRVANLRRRTRGGVSCTAAGNIRDD